MLDVTSYAQITTAVQRNGSIRVGGVGDGLSPATGHGEGEGTPPHSPSNLLLADKYDLQNSLSEIIRQVQAARQVGLNCGQPDASPEILLPNRLILKYLGALDQLQCRSVAFCLG